MEFKLTSKIKRIIARDSKVMINTARSDVPFVPYKHDGEIVYDVSGNKFIDFATFISVYPIGKEGLEQAKRAVKVQMDRIMHSASTDFYSEVPVEFAENLVTMFPKGFGRVFFSNSGTEANEASMKFAKYFTNRKYILGFYNAFHGRTMGSLAITSSKAIQRERFGPFPAAAHTPYAYCYRCPLNLEYPSCGVACADYINDYVLGKEVSPNEVAAIIMEPIQGEGGYVVPPKEFVQKIRKIATDNGMLLISDEVQAGYMRTGKFIALDNFGVEADIYSMAKALGAGLPMGASIVRSSYGNLAPGAQGSTFSGNPAVAAGANALLTYVKKNMGSLEAGVKSRGKLVMSRLNEMKEKYEIIGDVRGIGLMVGVEFVKDKNTKEYAVKEREEIIKKCFASGLVLLSAGKSAIRIIPPITISFDNLEKGLDIFEAAVKSVNQN